MSLAVPKGFELASVHCGIKRNLQKPDLTLVVSRLPATAAGVYTTNRVFAAPVGLNRRRTPGRGICVVVINSGNANACTGRRGEDDAARMAELAAAACGAAADQAIVLSTGVIGEFLPMEKIAAGIAQAAGRLARDEAALVAAARGMMTTDTVHKLAGRSLSLAGRAVQLTGMAKGAAMIGPRMATMLSVLLTDAAVDPASAQRLLSTAVDDTFNCISVEGHMSTNDSVVLLANGAAGTGEPAGEDLQRLSAAVRDVCEELARAIVADGEGCTHLVTIDVAGCASREAAHRIARCVAHSPLVKAALAGGDPNWGRILSAAGYAGVDFDPARVTLNLNGFTLFAGGAPAQFDAAAVSGSLRASRDVHLAIKFEEGTSSVRFWTTDLTAEYVRLNADYRT